MDLRHEVERHERHERHEVDLRHTVWDMHSRLYINRKMPGRFHRSSSVAGGAVEAAGSIKVEEGVLNYNTVL